MKGKDREQEKSIFTKSIHAGRGPCATQIQSPRLLFSHLPTPSRTAGKLKPIQKTPKESAYEYGRYGNPTEKVAERRLAELDGAEEALMFSSGMMAITTTILALVQSGDHIVITDDCYGRMLEFCRTYLKRFGIECTIVPFGDYEAFDASIKKNTRFIFSESPTNPYLNVFDMVKFKQIGEKHKVITIIDSTFATPYNQRPLEYGIDLVIHSGTKYLGGHNDILAGVLLGKKELVNKVRELHKSMGGVIDAHCCYLLLRGLKTFPLRVKTQNENALKIAEYLENHPKIERAYYPFLKSHAHYNIARTQMKGGGGVVTFTIKGDLDAAKRFMDSLEMIYIAPSLGGVETLITHPATVTYYRYTREQRYELGIVDNLFRLAVGIEDVEDIIADLERGFAKI